MSSAPRAVIVAGMHRSGTSMVAGMVAALGVDLGRRLIAADEANPRGYFEDAEIVAFHGELFRALLPPDVDCHVDWGWSEQAELDRSGLDRFLPRMQALVAARAGRGRPWGFKDPRATLLLDAWDRCIEEARFVLVYRFPWQVADSMLRGGARVFQRHRSYGYRAWAHYNAHVADFFRRQRERCLLVSADALPGELARFQDLLRDRLGLDPGGVDLAQRFEARLFTPADASDPRADLTEEAFPECRHVLAELDRLADIPSGRHGSSPAAAPRSGPVRRPSGPVDVSVVVPVHDDGVLLLDAVASVERCRPPATEVIVVDDGSEDRETLRILDVLRARGYDVLRKPNGGLSSARNAGIERARGRFLLPLDADNRLRPGFVEAAVEALQADRGLGVVYGDRQLFGVLREVVPVPDFDLDKMLGGNYIDACALYRRELWSDAGGYDTAMSGLEDWEFWLQASRRGWRFRHLDRIAFDYRVRPDSLLAASLTPATRRELTDHILCKHFDLFHDGLPLPLRALSDGCRRLLPAAWSARLRRGIARGFWHPLWTLIGPGGLLAADRSLRRRLRQKEVP